MNGDLTVTCPKCGHTGHVPPRFAGHLIHCKHCDQHFPVPPLTTTSGAQPDIARAPAAAAPALQPAPQAAAFAALDDDVPLAPLPEDEEKHCRERYEARVLNKKRGAHHDHDHGEAQVG